MASWTWSPTTAPPEPGLYRTETLSNLIAGIYDMTAPAMSLAVWRCSPLRWVDSENRALGRANGGVYLRAPISTGLVLDHTLASYHDVLVLGVDRSWNMLRRAAKRLEHTTHPVQLIRVDYARLPFRPGAIDSMQSFNGMQIFQKRIETLREFARCLKPGGHLSGSTLIRGQEYLADAVLDRYERYGFYPMLRTAEYLLKDFEEAGLGDIHFETHGAVMFFSGTPIHEADSSQAA